MSRGLQKAIEVTPILPMAETQSRQLPGFYVNVTMGNARTAQQVCTAVTSMFIEENLRQRQEHSANTTQFLVGQLAEAKANLDEQDAKLAAFKSHYLGSLPDNETMNLNLLTNLRSQLDAATQALGRAQQEKSFHESMLIQQTAAWQATQTGRSPETLEQQLVALQSQLASLQSRYTDDYPDVIKAKNDIAALKKQIAAEAMRKSRLPMRVRPRRIRWNPHRSRSCARKSTISNRRLRKEPERQAANPATDQGSGGSSAIQPSRRAAIQGTHARLPDRIGFLQRLAEEKGRG